MKRALFSAALLTLLVGCNKPSEKISDASKEEAKPPKADAKPVATAPAKKSWDGPFGVQMGIKKEDLEKAIKIESPNGFFYGSSSAPQPHDQFKTYVYFLTEEEGLCSVTGYTDYIQTNSFGEQVRSTYENLKEVLAGKYKEPTFSHDFVKHGSLWTDRRDFMMGLMKEERLLSSTWFNKSDDANLPKNKKNYAELPETIYSISLDAEADQTDRARIRINYAFANNDKCVDIAKKAKNKSL